MIDHQELARSLRYLVHEWSDATLAVVCDELAREIQSRGLDVWVGVELAARRLREHRRRYPHRDDAAPEAPRPAEPIHSGDCSPPSS